LLISFKTDCAFFSFSGLSFANTI
jgi:hypothetical protein